MAKRQHWAAEDSKGNNREKLMFFKVRISFSHQLGNQSVNNEKNTGAVLVWNALEELMFSGYSSQASHKASCCDAERQYHLITLKEGPLDFYRWEQSLQWPRCPRCSFPKFARTFSARQIGLADCYKWASDRSFAKGQGTKRWTEADQGGKRACYVVCLDLELTV